MKKRIGLLTLSFIAFYALVHLIRHVPSLAHGQFDLGGEKTVTLSIIRNGADMLTGYLAALCFYLVLCTCYPAKRYIEAAGFMLLAFVATFALSYYWNDFMEGGVVRPSDFFAFSIFFYLINIIFSFVFYFYQVCTL